MIAPELISHFSIKWGYPYLTTLQIILDFASHYAMLIDNMNIKTKKYIYTKFSGKLFKHKQIQQINTTNLIEEPLLIRNAVYIKRILNENRNGISLKYSPKNYLTINSIETVETIGLIVSMLIFLNKDIATD